MKSREINLEKRFQEFDPYLTNAVMERLNKKTGQQVLIDKSNLIEFLIRKCRESPEFVRRLETALFNVFDPHKVKDHPMVIKRILDINLLYRLDGSFNLGIGRKVHGRALELVVESVLESKNSLERFDYEFVDWKGIDYMILDRDKNDWIIGIQCKTALQTTKGYLNYKIELKKLKRFAEKFPKDKIFIMFCGNASCYKDRPYRLQKEEIKHTFEKEGWKFYYFWNSDDSYEIDESFYEFIDEIERITRQ